MKTLFSIFFIALGTLLFVGCTKAEDPTITVSIPKGYTAPTPIPNDSWRERMTQIMAHGLESEAVAAEVAPPAPQPEIAPTPKLRPHRTLTTKSGRRNHGHKSAGHPGRGRHGRHAR